MNTDTLMVIYHRDWCDIVSFCLSALTITINDGDLLFNQ
jgi:hypothetical protein